MFQLRGLFGRRSETKKGRVIAMQMYEPQPNGTLLQISPLIFGIDHDIEICYEIVIEGIKCGITEEELYKIGSYCEQLLYVKDKLIELDRESVGIPMIFDKYL